MKWCCTVMQNWYHEGGQRGFSINVCQRGTNYHFVMLHCALEPGMKIPADFQGPVSVVSEIVLQYCPWCGKKLEKFYKKDLPSLVRKEFGVPIE